MIAGYKGIGYFPEPASVGIIIAGKKRDSFNQDQVGMKTLHPVLVFSSS